MENKKKIKIFLIIIICIILIIGLAQILKKNHDNNTNNKNVEDYVKEHYLKIELLEYLKGEVTQENKIAYTIDEINRNLGQKQKEVPEEEVKNKYNEIFNESLEINEPVFILTNGYEYKQSRKTFLNNNDIKSNIPEDEESKRNLEIVGSKYNKKTDEYIVTIEERMITEQKQTTINISNIVLKSNNGGYIITNYYNE